MPIFPTLIVEALSINGLGIWIENINKHGIWGRNSLMNCFPYLCYSDSESY